MFERNFKNVLEIPLENRETPTIQVFWGKLMFSRAQWWSNCETILCAR